MLNGRNWWTDKAVDYSFKEDLDERINEAAKLIWDDWFGIGLEKVDSSRLATAIKQAMQMVNNPGVDPRKFL